MPDGIQKVRSKHMLISSVYMPVFRIDREDGILELQVHSEQEVSILKFDLDGGTPSTITRSDGTVSKIQANFMFLSYDEFTTPRPTGCNKVPEVINFSIVDAPDIPFEIDGRSTTLPPCYYHIEIYNDDDLAHA